MKYSEEQCREAAQMMAAGVSRSEVARAIGCPVNSVQTLVSRWERVARNNQISRGKWWHGLHVGVAALLEDHGYGSKKDAELLASDSLEFAKRRARKSVIDPLDQYGDRVIPLRAVNAVREWLGAPLLQPPKPAEDPKKAARMIRELEALGYTVSPPTTEQEIDT